MTAATVRAHRQHDGPPMTAEQVERLRAEVPDSPVPLPAGHLACPSCGIPVAVEPEPVLAPLLMQVGDPVLRPPVRYQRCPSCSEVRAEAERFVADHHRVAARFGTAVAADCTESVLLGLAVIGQPAPAGDALALALDRLLTAAGHSVRWRSPLSVTKDLASPHPWAHVPMGTRAALRRAYADVLRDQVARRAPAVPVQCPSLGGCILCGVPAVLVPAVTVAQHGSPQAAAVAVWRPVTTSPAALGGHGPGPLAGHLCPPCASAVNAEQAIGPPAIGAAVVAHLQATGRSQQARRLRTLLAEDCAPVMPAWAAQPPPRVPAAEPWQHLQRAVLGRL